MDPTSATVNKVRIKEEGKLWCRGKELTRKDVSGETGKNWKRKKKMTSLNRNA